MQRVLGSEFAAYECAILSVLRFDAKSIRC
jgi:hypothetical protein